MDCRWGAAANADGAGNDIVQRLISNVAAEQTALVLEIAVKSVKMSYFSKVIL